MLRLRKPSHPKLVRGNPHPLKPPRTIIPNVGIMQHHPGNVLVTNSSINWWHRQFDLLRAVLERWLARNLRLPDMTAALSDPPVGDLGKDLNLRPELAELVEPAERGVSPDLKRWRKSSSDSEALCKENGFSFLPGAGPAPADGVICAGSCPGNAF